jgi:hypothetical protein
MVTSLNSHTLIFEKLIFPTMLKIVEFGPKKYKKLSGLNGRKIEWDQKSTGKR